MRERDLFWKYDISLHRIEKEKQKRITAKLRRSYLFDLYTMGWGCWHEAWYVLRQCWEGEGPMALKKGVLLA